MKFTPDETVNLLSTAYKPVCMAVISQYDEESGKYQIIYQYTHPNKIEMLTVPPERMISQ